MSGGQALPQAVLEDRCAGVLVGLAAGDALGAAYEFHTPGPEHAEMVGGGVLGWEPGEWTDDTSQAICVAANAAPGGRIDVEGVARCLLDWYRAGPPDVGNQTRGVLDRCTAPGDLAASAARWYEQHPRGSAGNGSLMRTAPVALAFAGDDAPGRDERLAGAAREVSSLTHADPLTGDACVLWCIAIDRAIRDSRLDGISDGLALIPHERRGRWEDSLEQLRSRPAASFTENGFVVRALQAALGAIWQTPVAEGRFVARHLEHGLRAAVRVGDDTDTVAANAGALLGARYGATALPSGWTAMLHGSPGHSSADLVRLAVLAAGEAHHCGWPAADNLLDTYGSQAARGFARPCPGDDGVVIANLRGAIELQREAGGRCDVIVSLCRVGRRELEAPEWLQVRLIDSDDEAEHRNLILQLRDLARQIVFWRDSGKTVLVHGVASQSRTPAVAAAYLAERLHLPGREALRRVCAEIPEHYVAPPFERALDVLWPVQPDHGDAGVIQPGKGVTK